MILREGSMDAAGFRRLLNAIKDVTDSEKILDEIVIYNPGNDKAHRIDEGKWIKTDTTNTMRIDQPTHGAGQTHAHIYGRKGNVMGVVNLDGTASHGTQMRLSKKDAETLRVNGFNIRPDRIVEWIARSDLTRQLLLG